MIEKINANKTPEFICDDNCFILKANIKAINLFCLNLNEKININSIIGFLNFNCKEKQKVLIKVKNELHNSEVKVTLLNNHKKIQIFEINSEEKTSDSQTKLEKKYYNIFENAFDGIMIVDLDKQTLIECNKKTYELFGKKNINNKNLSYFFFNITFDKFDEYYYETIKKGKVNFESYFTNHERLIYLDIIFSKIYKNNNNIMAILFKDITLDKKIDRAINQAFKNKFYNNEKDFYNNVLISLSCLIPNNLMFLGKLNKEQEVIETKSFLMNSKFKKNINYAIKNTPCEDVLLKRKPVSLRNIAQEIYYKDLKLKMWKAESYISYPIFYSNNNVYGNLTVLCNNKLSSKEELLSNRILKIFSNRISSELEKIK